jgi:hypothetical protein
MEVTMAFGRSFYGYDSGWSDDLFLRVAIAGCISPLIASSSLP